MANLVPVDFDPFAGAAGPNLVPVDNDPFEDKRDLKTIRNDYLKALSAGDQAGAKANAEAYVRKENTDSPIATGIGNRVRQFAKGVPVIGGALDEINAATASIMPGGPSYQEALDYQRAKDRVFEQDRPKESFGLQLGGGLASGVGAAAKIAPMLSNASRAAVLGTGVGGGATLGGTDAFLRGEGGFENRAKDALVGSAVGGAVGGLAPVVAKGVSAGISSLIDVATTNRDLQRMGLSRGSGDVINRVLSADNTLGGQGAANIAAAGPRAMLADAGPNARGLLDTTIQRGGQGANAALRSIEERAAGANQDITGSLNRSLGNPEGLTTATENIRRNSAVPRFTAYDAAYNTPINYASPDGMALEQMLTRVPGAHINTANQMMQLEGQQSRQILARIAPDGTVTYERLPDVRQLDYITRALNQAAESGEGAGALGGQTPLGRLYQGLAGDIRGTLRRAVPEYDTALQTAAEPIRRVQAIEFGRNVLNPQTTRDDVARWATQASNPERDAAATAIRSRIDETVSNVQRVASDPNLDAREATKALRDLSSRAAREKIEVIVGPQRAQSLFADLDTAIRSMELRAETRANSRTFARTATNETVKELTAPGPFGLLTGGSPLLAARKTVQGLLGTEQANIARQDRVYNELAGALTGPRGADAQRFILDLADAYRRKGYGNAAAQSIGLLTAGAGAGAAYPAIYQQLRPSR